MALRGILSGLWLGAVLCAAASPVDLSGRPVDPLANTEARAVVLVFLRSDCPISNRYAPEIQRLHARFAPLGVAFWMVYPDPQASAESIRRHVKEYGYPGEILRDPGHVLVKTAGVEVTPEAALFAPGRRLVYRGRIDDRYVDFGKMRPSPATRDLEVALEAALAGRPAPEPFAKAVGCFLSDLR